MLIIGGACMGAATAYHLVTAAPGLEVLVYDRDHSLALSSTLRSDGNVRVQFNLEENIAISLYALEVLATFADDMAVPGYRPDPLMRKQGNLFFVDAASREAARQGRERQLRMGAKVEWLEPEEIADRWPALATDAFLGATFGPDDGSVDPAAVTQGYRRKAAARGVRFLDGEVVALREVGGRAGGVTLADGEDVDGDAVVVCAGAWSGSLLATIGVEIPVIPVMRTVYVVAGGYGPALPSFFLPSGVYVIPEHEDRFLIAWSLPSDPVGFDFTPAERSRFYDLIWPELVSHLPAWDSLEVVGSWAGLYELNTLDANAIVGEWPSLPGLYQATGFSGHGFQQCHAVGRYLAELITGRPPSLDLGRLGPERIVASKPLREHAGKII